MQLNWIGYQYRDWDGYGRYGNRMVQALLRAGVAVHPLLNEHCNMPSWMQEGLGIDWSRLTISCLPPFYLKVVPGRGRHWLLSMTEGSELPPGWAETIQEARIERIIVPCEHNARAFEVTGLPVHVVHGGTDPEEFPVIRRIWGRSPFYQFLALGDRGSRKGWVEVWQAFYLAFGTPAQTPDVRLVIKARPDGNELLSTIAQAEHPDPRITIRFDDAPSMADVYRLCDCFVIPSRFEGWGMPHREAAMMGLPVITQRHAGMDDGHTEQWAIVVEGGTLERIPGSFEHIAGEWLRASVEGLATAMRDCYNEPTEAAIHGRRAAAWLRQHQTWDHAAGQLLNLIREYS